MTMLGLVLGKDRLACSVSSDELEAGSCFGKTGIQVKYTPGCKHLGVASGYVFQVLRHSGWWKTCRSNNLGSSLSNVPIDQHHGWTVERIVNRELDKR